MLRPILAALWVAASMIPTAYAESPTAQEAPEVDARLARLRGRLTLAPAVREGSATLAHLPTVNTAPPWAHHSLAPPYAGVITSTAARAGQRIAVGDLIAEVRSPDLKALKAAEARWRRVARDRRKHAETLARQVEAGFQSAQPLYEARLAAREAEAMARTAAATRRAQLSWVSGVTEEGLWRWVSGVPGLIVSVSCGPGERVSGEAPCLEVVDPDAVEVEIQVPERHLSALAQGGALRWTPTDGGATRTLALRRRAARVNPTTGTMAVYFGAEGGAPLTLGATGRGELLADAAPGSLRVPPGAVTTLSGQAVVFVERDVGQLPSPSPVTVVGRIGPDVLILAADIAPGTPIVTRGAFLLKSLTLIDAE